MTLAQRFFVGLLTGGLLFSSLSIAASPTATIPLRKEHPGSLPILISLEHVSNDLHLTSLQKSVIAGIRSDYRAAAMKITQTERRTSSSMAQLQMKLDSLSITYNERALAVLNTRQCLRLHEIERQVLGGTLLTTPSEQQFLEMTDLQKKKIAKIQEDSNKQASGINHRATEGKLNYHQQIIELRKARQKHADAMLKVLTPEQLKTWENAQGAKLVF